jgi:hypothetical protein
MANMIPASIRAREELSALIERALPHDLELRLSYLEPPRAGRRQSSKAERRACEIRLRS